MLTCELTSCNCIFSLSVLCFKREIKIGYLRTFCMQSDPSIFSSFSPRQQRRQKKQWSFLLWFGVGLYNHKGVIFFIGAKAHLCYKSNGKKQQLLCSDTVLPPSCCSQCPHVCLGGPVDSSWTCVGFKWCLEEQFPWNAISGSPLLFAQINTNVQLHSTSCTIARSKCFTC